MQARIIIEVEDKSWNFLKTSLDNIYSMFDKDCVHVSIGGDEEETEDPENETIGPGHMY